jgi:lipopolysaccharide transport system permease protein
VTSTPTRQDADGAPQPTIVIEARPETVSARLRSLWRYRGFYSFLFKELTMRKGRGTLLGIWGILLRPIVPAVGLIFAFGSVRPVDTGGVPYAIFFLSGYIPWQVFQSALRYLPRSLGWSQGLMKRTYFPRLLVPLAGFGMPFIEFLILALVFVVAIAMTMWRGEPFPLHLGWHTLWLVPCLIGTLLFALSFGLVFSVVALFFRDVIFSLRFFAQIMMFLTPVIYPVTFIPEAYRWVVYVLNPMAQLVIVCRYALIGEGDVQLPFLLLSFAMILVALVGSVAFFLRAELHLGDQM